MTQKKPSSRLEGMQQWLNSEIEKDQVDLNNEKNRFIDQIKKIKKEDIIPVREEIKLTIWQKIKKVLMG
jgi:hypothetical protein